MMTTHADGAVATREVSVDLVSRYGIVATMPETALVSHIVEKPKQSDAPSRTAICARYLVDTSLFDIIRSSKPNDGSEHQLTGCINQWIESGHTLENIPLIGTEKRHDVGNFDTYYASILEMALEEAVDRPQLVRILKEYLQ
jgi:UTP--glucose-1-phosphate uridylyltransferase